MATRIDDAWVEAGLRAGAPTADDAPPRHRERTADCLSQIELAKGVAPGHAAHVAECAFCRRMVALAAAARRRELLAQLRVGGQAAREALEALAAAGAAWFGRGTLMSQAVGAHADVRTPDYGPAPSVPLRSGAASDGTVYTVRMARERDALVEVALPAGPAPVLVRFCVAAADGPVWQRLLVLRPLGRERIARCRVDEVSLALMPKLDVILLSPTDLDDEDLEELNEALSVAVRDDPAAVPAWRAWSALAAEEAPPALRPWLNQVAKDWLPGREDER